MPPDMGKEPGSKGTVQAWRVPTARGKADGLNCTGHRHLDGPGYRMFYGETTKRASEGSVVSLTSAPTKAGWGREYFAIRIGQP
jgi:hypothetical protein